MSASDAAPDPRRVAEAMWRRDAQAKHLGIKIHDVSLGAVTVRMPVDGRHTGDHGLVHGGVLFTLADVAMAYACNTYDVHALATGASINFVDSARPGETLEAAATEHSLRGKSGIYDVVVRSLVNGRLVATFRGNTLRVGGSVIDLEPR